MVVRRDEDQALALRTLLEFEQAQHGLAIVRIAAQPVARLGRVGDETAAFQMRGDGTDGCERTMQESASRQASSPIPHLPQAGDGGRVSAGEDAGLFAPD